MTASNLTDRARVELAAIEVVLWGCTLAVIDAVEAGTLRADLFLDDTRREVVEVVVALIDDGIPLTPAEVHQRLLALGWNRMAATDAVLNGSGFEVADHRLDGLGYRLAALAEQARREQIEHHLADLAHRLRFPGGVDRVADLLGVAS